MTNVRTTFSRILERKLKFEYIGCFWRGNIFLARVWRALFETYEETFQLHLTEYNIYNLFQNTSGTGNRV